MAGYSRTRPEVDEPPATPRSRSENPLLWAARSAKLSSSPATPRTPIYTGDDVASTYNSPGLSFRTDDETLVFDFNTRCIRAGLAGEPSPRSCSAFSPQAQRRTGEYGEYSHMKSAGYHHDADDAKYWGRSHELWRADVRSLNLGHVFDKLERVIRNAVTNDLLMHDDMSKRVVTSLPSQLPHPLLSILLMALFTVSPVPTSVTLLPNPVMCVVAAGVRSGLVIDIDWHETVITAVYEYREIMQRTTCRGMKLLSWNMKRMLEEKLKNASHDQQVFLSFEYVEDVVSRLAWCPLEDGQHADASWNNPITIPIPSIHSDPIQLTIPFLDFSIPVTSTFFPMQGLSDKQERLDDQETSLPFLAYSVLLRLPVDLREHLLNRVIVTGSGSIIPGLIGRVLSDMTSLLEKRSWDPVHNYGSVQDSPSLSRNRRNTYARSIEANTTNDEEPSPPSASSTNSQETRQSSNTETIPAHLRQQYDDATILSAMRAHTIYSLSITSPSELLARDTDITRSSNRPGSIGPIRAIHSLGAWAGASLASGLKIPGVVQISRDEFLKHGLAGADRESRKTNVDVKTEAPGGNLRERLTRRVTSDGASRKEGGGGGGGFTLGSWR